METGQKCCRCTPPRSVNRLGFHELANNTIGKEARFADRRNQNERPNYKNRIRSKHVVSGGFTVRFLYHRRQRPWNRCWTLGAHPSSRLKGHGRNDVVKLSFSRSLEGVGSQVDLGNRDLHVFIFLGANMGNLDRNLACFFSLTRTPVQSPFRDEDGFHGC